jgi:hypothetical protein
MMTETMTGKRVRICSVWMGAIACALLASPGRPALADLPPRPTPQPTQPPPPAPSGLAGGSVELRVQFSETWARDGLAWQDLWTVVQWQDPSTGAWRDVEGWQGGLDAVEVGEGGAVVGHKGWWVAQGDLGSGPFRWQVYQSRTGRLLGTSEPFDLPGSSGATATVEVTLAP